MPEDKRPLSWWQRFMQTILGPPPAYRGQSTPAPSRSTKPKPVLRSSTTTIRPRAVTYSSTHITEFSSGDTLTQPVIIDQATRIENLADGLDRQADRFENSGDFTRAQELRDAAVEVRDSGNFALAESIVAGVDSSYAPSGDFGSVSDFSSGFDPAVDDPMGSSSYTDNS